MNILIDDINKVVSQQISVEFRTDFRISMMFELLMQDQSVDKEEKIIQALKLYYPKLEQIEEIGIERAIDNILWFYKCGKEQEDKEDDSEDNEEEEENKKAKQIYSYDFDDKYIFSAFLDQYNINLQSIEYLHW